MFCALAADRIDLLLEIRQQRRLDLRSTEPSAPKGCLFDQYGRKVADQRSILLVARPAEGERFPLEDFGIRVRHDINGRHIPHSERMVLPNRLPGYRNIFAAVGGSSRRTGKQCYTPRCRNVLLPVEHPLNIGLKTVIILHFDPLSKTFRRDIGRNGMIPTKPGPSSFSHQTMEHFLLHLDRMTAEIVYCPHPPRKIGSQQTVSNRHCPFVLFCFNHYSIAKSPHDLPTGPSSRSYKRAPGKVHPTSIEIVSDLGNRLRHRENHYAVISVQFHVPRSDEYLVSSHNASDDRIRWQTQLLDRSLGRR